MKPIVTRILAAITVLALLLPASAAFAAVSGQVKHVLGCGSGSSSRRSVLALVETGGGASYWFWIADSNYPSSLPNEELALAAMLSGKWVTVQHNSTSATFCGISTTGTVFTSGEYIRIDP